MRYGVKAALNDAHVMAALDVDLLEVHMRPGDLQRHRGAMVGAFRGARSVWGHDLVVHVPETMQVAGETVLVDPSCPDEALRSMAVTTLEATIDLAREIDAHLLVMHPGGILPSASSVEAEGGIDRLVTSLRYLRDLARDAGLAITLENMPWFYHRKAEGGGKAERWESTILVMPGDMDILAKEVDGMTLDVSHGFLYSPRGGMEVIEGFIDRHGDRIKHLHLSDALAPEHEGLQIGAGMVDFPAVLSAFANRDVSAVPEIIGGHRGGGLGFKRALEELRGIEAGMD